MNVKHLLAIAIAVGTIGSVWATTNSLMDPAQSSSQDTKPQQQQPSHNHLTTIAAAAQEQERQEYTPKTVEYTLVAQNTTVEIAPDVRVQAWTYNGTIPGPTMTATEGDRVILHFKNDTPMAHTIHLHGDHDEKDDGVFQEIQPGEEYTYDFIAEPAGALMYHCHVMPVTEHIRMGLYGALIVYPQQPLPPAREYVVVAGEYDTKDQLTENPEFVMFNGYADGYWENPLPARMNELVRVYFINLGSSPAFGFHIHGTLFDVYPSGVWENEPVRAQTWEVAAGNAAIFEAKWPWEGRYLFHLHGTPEEKGTMGYFNVTDAHGEADGAAAVEMAQAESISMVGWQEELTRTLQKQDPDGKVSVTRQQQQQQTSDGGGGGHSMAGSHQPANQGPVETTDVSIPKKSSQRSSGLTFAPEQIVIKAGDTVTWKNDDSTTHTVKSKQEGLFFSAAIGQKRTFEHTFAEAGEYEYYCSLHPWMTGGVTVK
jgi:nitrite reductase (NO-forming)